MSAPLSEAIASPLARVRTPVVLSATEVCLVVQSPGPLARIRKRDVRYKILGPGGKHGSLSVPVTGLVEGVTLSTSKLEVEVAVESIPLADAEFPLERVDVRLFVRLNPAGRFQALLDYVADAGPDFLATVDADLAEAVTDSVRNHLRERPAVEIYRDGLTSLELPERKLLDGVLVVERATILKVAFHPKHQDVLESKLDALVGEQTHENDKAQLARERELADARELAELERNGARARAELEIDNARREAERPYEREREQVELFGKAIEAIPQIRNGRGFDAIDEVRKSIAAYSGNRAEPIPPPPGPRAELEPEVVDFVDSTAHTTGTDPVPDPHWLALIRDAGISPNEVFAVAIGPSGSDDLLVIALRSRPPHALRTQLRRLLEAQQLPHLVLSPVTSHEELVLEFLFAFEPALEKCDPDLELERDGDRVRVSLSGSEQPLRPHIRRFIEADSQDLDALAGVLHCQGVDLDLA